GAQTSSVHVSDLVQQAWATIEQRYDSKQPVTGLATGYRDLDRLTAGLHPGQLVIVAARPSLGKTTLALNIAAHTALAGDTVAVFSLEMPSDEIAERLLCAEAGVDSQRMRTGFLHDNDWTPLT